MLAEPAVTAKTVCPTHERAHDVGKPCDWCAPADAEPDTDRITLPDLDDWLKQYIGGHGFDASGMYHQPCEPSVRLGYYTSDTHAAIRMMLESDT
jgi:hypothetical protein